MNPAYRERVDVYANKMHIGCLAKDDVTEEILDLCREGIPTITMNIEPTCKSYSDLRGSYANFYIR